jgi:hypothetical protein
VTAVLVAAGLALVIVALFLTLFGSRRKVSSVPNSNSKDSAVRPNCPLCGSRLGPGERVHSTVFESRSEDKLMEIAGCPHCRPPATLRRVCPVCKKDLRPADVVTARVFERPGAEGAKKTHVHVLGCPRCRTSRD